MPNQFVTSHGLVEVSEVYFSKVLLCKVHNLTITPKNNEGWGVSKEFDANEELNLSLAEGFASKAMEYL